jgi:hypothetical protein
VRVSGTASRPDAVSTAEKVRDTRTQLGVLAAVRVALKRAGICAVRTGVTGVGSRPAHRGITAFIYSPLPMPLCPPPTAPVPSSHGPCAFRLPLARNSLGDTASLPRPPRSPRTATPTPHPAESAELPSAQVRGGMAHPAEFKVDPAEFKVDPAESRRIHPLPLCAACGERFIHRERRAGHGVDPRWPEPPTHR